MTKSSDARKARRRKKLRQQRKPRTEYIYATTVGEVSEIEFVHDGAKGDVTFKTPVQNAYHETSYQRPRRPKVLNRVPLPGPGLQFASDDALLRNFDFLVAIDTNTKAIGSHAVSVTGVVIEDRTRSENRNGAIGYRVPFCIETTDLDGCAERNGWIEGMRRLAAMNLLPRTERIGLIVDHDMNSIPSINRREQPILGNVYLPSNVQLIYASADVGVERLANKFMHDADRAATLVHDCIEAGRLTINAAPGSRVIFGSATPSLRKCSHVSSY